MYKFLVNDDKSDGIIPTQLEISHDVANIHFALGHSVKWEHGPLRPCDIYVVDLCVLFSNQRVCC